MSCPESWVESVLAALAATYGVAFQRQYADLKPELVRHRWKAALDGFTSETIRRALDKLPPDAPPNALQFRRLCVEAIKGEAYRVHQLPAPVAGVPSHVVGRLAELRKRRTGYATKAEQDAALARAEGQALQDPRTAGVGA